MHSLTHYIRHKRTHMFFSQAAPWLTSLAALLRYANCSEIFLAKILNNQHINMPTRKSSDFLYKICNGFRYIIKDFLTTTVQSLNASRPHLGQRLRSTSSTDFSLPQLRITRLESVLSCTPVSLHGTHCPNTSVLNLTFVFLGNYIFLT